MAKRKMRMKLEKKITKQEFIKGKNVWFSAGVSAELTFVDKDDFLIQSKEVEKVCLESLATDIEMYRLSELCKGK